jgi:type II secretory pathway pseudopilin PulG
MKLPNKTRGFTVVELIISTGIIVLITGAIFISYPRFKARTSLAALAREVGLIVREAQVYGLSVKEFPDIMDRFPPYGVHVSMESPKEFVLFGDLESGTRENIYDSDEGCGADVGKTECIRRISFSGPEFVQKICVITGTLVEDCSITELNVTFHRPDPEAYIVVKDPAVRYNGANIYLQSRKDSRETKQVRIWITGQISIL